MAILLAYNFTSDLAPSTTASGVNGGTITNNLLSALVTTTGLGYASQPLAVANPASGATSEALAVTNGSYFFLTITPQSSKQISLSSMTFNISRGGASTPRGYQVRSSADAFAASLSGGDVLTARSSATFTPITVDLSGAGFQNVTTTLTFNVYIYAPGTGNSLDIDDLVLNGTVADTGTVEQEGYRWRADDGSETTATWLAGQDTNITRAKSSNTRLRMILNGTLDPGAANYQLEYREVGGTDWTAIE